ncbi:hypothetical protein C8Q80DRAFT_1264298 [Daedaleopsis nitida]|nr:hypothetical protein C8Q80DRAFT_1264298 [Daedaleopsis nitida]
MASTPPRPPPQFTIFFLENKDVEDIRRDIVLLSYLLSEVDHHDNKDSGQKKALRRPTPMQPWVHLAFMLTAGDKHDRYSNQVVAVTGRVENDAITAVLVAHTTNASLRYSDPFSFTELKPDATKGEYLLGKPASIEIDVPFSQHATDVFWIVRYPFSPTRPGNPIPSKRRISRLALFISRCCYCKLHARIDQGKRLWSDHPLQLIHAWYHTSQTTSAAVMLTTPLASKRSALPADIQSSLAKYSIAPDKVQLSTSGTLVYTVNQDTAKLWTNMLRQLLETMLQSYTEQPWTQNFAIALWTALAIYSSIQDILEHLITPDLAMYLGEQRKRGKQRLPRLQQAILNPAPDTSSVGTAVISEMHVQNDDRHRAISDHGANNVINEDDHEHKKDNEDNENNEDDNEDDKEQGEIPGVHGAAKWSMLRYLRTLCIAVDAAKFYTSYADRFHDRDIGLRAYILPSKPSIPPPITSTTVRDFAGKFMSHFSPSLPSETNVTAAFEKLAMEVEKQKYVNAAEHAEAIIMALACNPAGSGVVKALGLKRESEAATDIQSIFDISRRPNGEVPVGVSKKCCFCCHKLATLLKQHADRSFVLQGTNSMIFPWIPPKGIPLDVLTELRLTLLRVLYDTVEQTVHTLSRSVQMSPAETLSPVDSQLDFNDEFLDYI